MNVEHLMNQPAITCRPSDNLNTAAQLMWEYDFGALVVVDEDEGKVVGMITDRDICMAAYTQGKPLCEISVNGAMSHQVFACHREETLEDVESSMSDHQVRRLAVVDDAGRPVGVIAANDIVRHAASSARTQRADRDAIQTLAAIGARRPPGPVGRGSEPRVLMRHAGGAREVFV